MTVERNTYVTECYEDMSTIAFYHIEEIFFIFFTFTLSTRRYGWCDWGSSGIKQPRCQDIKASFCFIE